MPHILDAKPVVRRERPALRPPALMLDLLAATCMFFAFQMGPNKQAISSHEMRLPTQDGTGQTEVLPLIPECCWSYQTPEGRTVKAEQAAALAKGKTIVLLLEAQTSLQSYLDAQAPLAKFGVSIGLAVTEDDK